MGSTMKEIMIFIPPLLSSQTPTHAHETVPFCLREWDGFSVAQTILERFANVDRARKLYRSMDA